MLRATESKALRTILITAGALLAGVLLLLMTGLNLLVMFGYIPYAVRSLLSGADFSQRYLKDLTQWTTLHQLLCLAGGFLWLGAAVAYSRRSAGACLVCGRRDAPEGWTSPSKAARWGRIAVYVSLVAPVFYAITRFVWALGIPMGMNEASFRHGQETGMWISGLFLATFGLVGAALTFGLVQRWGEVFPRWMIGLAGRRVPVALAVAPALFVSVLLIVGGIVIGLDTPQMAEALKAAGTAGSRIFVEVFFQLGPTLLFPVWGLAVAAAALAYFYRRRGPCSVCGRGEPVEAGELLAGRFKPDGRMPAAG